MRLEPLPLGEFLAQPESEVTHVVSGLLPSEGIVLLVGAEKTGKTLLSGQLALCIAAGIPWLGMDTKPSRVLDIEEEGARPSFKEHLAIQAAALGVGTDTDDLLVSHRQRIRLDDPDCLVALEAAIAERGIEVVLMNPLAQLADIDDENKAAGFNGIARSLVDIVERTGTLFVLAHHRRKTDPSKTKPLRPSEFFQSSRGSSALTAAMDVGLGLDRDPESRSGRLHVMGRDVPTETIPVSFDPDTLLFSTVVGEVQTREDQQLATLLEALREADLTAEQGQTVLGVRSLNTARARLQRLVADGKATVVKGDHGRQVYSLIREHLL